MTMNNQFDVTYFIEKFSAIPDERWTTCTQLDSEGRRCAVGHCNKNELTALRGIIRGIMLTNDGAHCAYQQPTPKARILAALHDAEAALDAYELRELQPINNHQPKEQLCEQP